VCGVDAECGGEELVQGVPCWFRGFGGLPPPICG
ncbi:hypothetical protein A2U01_0066370, partial [Trifolium medium]|nr:hypothetical protein [Trifolium medium]